VGVGINVNNDPTEVNPQATSLYKLKGSIVSRKQLLTHFISRLQHNLPQTGEHLLSAWKHNSISLNRHVRVKTPAATFTGTALDIAPDGALLLRLGDGSIKPLYAGDVEFPS
jgi:BirA family biotin operon repressor/biotin-[acetyl-CoA-carboxylase] ligase